MKYFSYSCAEIQSSCCSYAPWISETFQTRSTENFETYRILKGLLLRSLTGGHLIKTTIFDTNPSEGNGFDCETGPCVNLRSRCVRPHNHLSHRAEQAIMDDHSIGTLTRMEDLLPHRSAAVVVSDSYYTVSQKCIEDALFFRSSRLMILTAKCIEMNFIILSSIFLYFQPGLRTRVANLQMVISSKNR